MPKRGENIYKRKDSRWEGRYIRCYDMTGSAQYGYVYARTYSEVKRKLIEAQSSGTTKAFHSQKTFGRYCDEWLLLSRSRVKESTYVKYYTIINHHIKPMLGNYMPHHLNTMLIEKYSHVLLTFDNLSVKTVRDILTVLKSVLKYVKRQIGNEMSDIEVIYPKEQQKEMRVLTINEQERLIQYLMTDMDTVKFGILLAFCTGMRIGEICALRWRDVSVENRMIHVSQTMQRLQTLEGQKKGKTRVFVGETKSKHSDRWIPLTDNMDTLCRHMFSQDEEAYVLTGDREKYIEPRALQYRLNKILKDCNLYDVHFHTLRHTFATRCVEVGFEIKSLSEILGHSSTKVTLDRYVHSSMELKRINMDKLSCMRF